MRTQTAILGMILAGATGASGALWLTSARIVEARANEAQANGLESECKASLPTVTHLPNGGWRLEHIPMLACPDSLRRTVEIPERDETDLVTINCGVEK